MSTVKGNFSEESFFPTLKFTNDKIWEYGEKEVTTDMVNSPAHYTAGRIEAIEVIEDAIEAAPSTKQGFLQAQVLKYLLRLWYKSNGKEDAEKAQWYLNRLVDSLNY
jgi:hypothetical protein